MATGAPAARPESDPLHARLLRRDASAVARLLPPALCRGPDPLRRPPKTRLFTIAHKNFPDCSSRARLGSAAASERCRRALPRHPRAARRKISFGKAPFSSYAACSSVAIHQGPALEPSPAKAPAVTNSPRLRETRWDWHAKDQDCLLRDSAFDKYN